MKPFNKEQALAGKPVITYDGRNVTQLKEFELPIKSEDHSFTLVGFIEGNSQLSTWTAFGKHSYSIPSIISRLDLFMKTSKKTGWIAFGSYSTHIWDTKEEAIASYKRVGLSEPKGAVEVSWEE